MRNNLFYSKVYYLIVLTEKIYCIYRSDLRNFIVWGIYTLGKLKIILTRTDNQQIEGKVPPISQLRQTLVEVAYEQ